MMSKEALAALARRILSELATDKSKFGDLILILDRLSDEDLEKVLKIALGIIKYYEERKGVVVCRR